jgi:cytochrome c5
MRSSLSKRVGSTLALLAGITCVATQAQTPNYTGIGRTPTEAEVQAWARTIGPSGKGLPPGKGTAKEGALIYARKCSYCHGENLKGVPRVNGSGNLVGGPALAGGRNMPLWGPDHNAPLTIGSYRPFATTVFDVIYRAMPAYQGGTLGADETYALTAYLLYKNDIIEEDAVIDRETLPKVTMPNRHGFVPDKFEDIPDIKKRGCYKTYGTCP